MMNLDADVVRKVFNRAPFGALCVIAVSILASQGFLTVPILISICFIYATNIIGEMGLCWLDCPEKIRTNGVKHEDD